MAETLIRRRSRRPKTRDPRDRELRRLLLSIRDDVGFRLFLATYDQPKRRDELIARVIEEAAAEKVKVTRLDIGDAGPETNLVGLLRAHLQSTDLPPGWRQAVMVTGIEQRLDYASGPKGYAFLHQVNLLRDALPEAAQVPVVLWLSRMASGAMPAEAPDLWHWRAANFDFTGDEAPRLELLRELTTLRPDEDLGLSGEQRQARVAMLQDLLAELERKGPPQTARQATERADLLLELAIEESRVGRPTDAIPRFEHALEIFRETGDQRGEGAALGSLGVAWYRRGELRRAIEFYKQQLDIAREIGDRRNEGDALGNLGTAWLDLGEPRRAIEHHEQQLAITREIGDRRTEGQVLGNLGIAWSNLGEPHRAIECYARSLAIAREIGDRRGEGNALGNLGTGWLELGEPLRAIGYYEQCLAIAREIADRRNEGASLGNLGIAYRQLGEPRRAIEHYEQHLKIANEIGDRMLEANALFNWANALDALGERAEAVRQMRGALAILEAIGTKDMLEKARAQLAEWTGEEA